MEAASDLRATDVHVDRSGLEFRIDGLEIRSRLRGGFNVSNCLASIDLARAAGLDDAAIVFSLLIASFVAIAVMIRRRREGGVLHFEVDLMMLWVGLTFVLMVGNPGSAEDVLARMAGLGSLWALGGGAVVAMSSDKRLEELPEET